MTNTDVIPVSQLPSSNNTDIIPIHALPKSNVTESPTGISKLADFARARIGPQLQAAGGYVDTAGFGLPGAAASYLPQPIKDYMQPRGPAEQIGRVVGNVAGFMAGPGAVAKAGREAIPLLKGAGLLSDASGGAKLAGLVGSSAETAAGYGMASAGKPENIGKESLKGSVFGFGAPLVGALAEAAGKPTAAWLQSFLTGTIPMEDGIEIMKNPEKITKSWLSQAKSTMDELKQKLITPRIVNPEGFKTDLSGLNNILTGRTLEVPKVDKKWDALEQGYQDPSPLMSAGGAKGVVGLPTYAPTGSEAPMILKVNGEWSDSGARLGVGERNAIDNVTAMVSKHQLNPTFNSANNILTTIRGYIDSKVDDYGKPLRDAKTFKTAMESMKHMVLDSMAKDQPEAMPAIQAIQEHTKWQARADKYPPIHESTLSFFRSLPMRMLLMSGFGGVGGAGLAQLTGGSPIKAGEAGLIAGMGTMPGVWGAGIRAGAGVGKVMTPELMRAIGSQVPSPIPDKNSQDQ